MGAQWLSGRVLDSRSKGRGFEPLRRHCVVFLSKNINPSLVLVQTRKTHPFITERLLVGLKESNQTNRTTKWNIPTAIINRTSQSISILRAVGSFFFKKKTNVDRALCKAHSGGPV